MTQTTYFLGNPVQGWSASLAARGTGMLLCGGGGAFLSLHDDRKNGAVGRLFLSGLLVIWLAMTLIVSRPEVLYNLIYAPFLIPLAVFFFARAGRPKWVFASLKALAAALLVCSTIFFARFARRDMVTFSPYSQVIAELNRLVPDRRLKIIGPNIFWFDRDPATFRDIGALTYSHWYSGGRRDLRSWLAPWKPDILIADETFNKLFIGNRPAAAVLGATLDAQVTPLGIIETGPGWYGRWEVYKLVWRTDRI